jgi:ribonuclease E
VIKSLKADGGKRLLELEDLTQRTVILKADPVLHQEQFDIN